MKRIMSAALVGSAAFFMSTPAAAEYVSANVLNCRAGPAASEAVVSKLERGQSVTVREKSGTWSRLSAPDCWVLTRYLSGDYVSSSSSGPSSFYGSSTSGSSSYGLSSSTRASAKKKPRSSKRRSGSSSQSGCPCSGSQVCIGPRGGRYCITSGGNKRYGV